MIRVLTQLCLLFVGLLMTVQAEAQKDMLRGIFDKEAPVFHTTVLPATDKGAIRLAVYFTHSKLNELELSYWMVDNGTMLQSDGKKKLVNALHKLGNRQQDTILITNLKEPHVYTFGADFRNPKSLSGKFASQTIHKGYRYQFRPVTSPTASVVDAMAKSPVIHQPRKAKVDCQDPLIDVRVEPAGYCGDDNRPAVLVQCSNCQGKQWSFSVEVRTNTMGPWQSVRYDGQRQSAVGVSLRTEPLCLLLPGNYQVQVLAWGENCVNPIVKTLGTNIVIPGMPTSVVAKPSLDRPAAPRVAEATSRLPDTCFVEGTAILNGINIKGTLSLSPYSPCADLRPYAEVVYVHPGHRNITLEQVPLIPGADVPFTIPLDARDLNRGIHTIQVIAYVQGNQPGEGIPLESFWMRAMTPQELTAEVRPGIPSNSAPAQTIPAPPTNPAPNTTPPPAITEQTMGATATTPQATTPKDDDYYIDPALMETTGSEVQVTASDPNCTPIQDIQLVFDSNQPNKPLFISWLNPRCCQEEGCTYTVWSGPDPKHLRLLMKGQKYGAIINEVLRGANPTDRYYEVVVKTGNGYRKAAYALGVGPLYGIQEIIDYHDQLYPPTMGIVEGVKEEIEETPASADATAKSPIVERAVLLNPVQPKMPVAEFSTCKYVRQTSGFDGNPVKVGEEITLRYDFNDHRYRYTLYHQPVGTDEWVIAPGTTELQERPVFSFRAKPYHAGKYLILTYKPSSSGGNGWGCLSADPATAHELRVQE